jgi:SAM-dependent methyltransferase
MTETENIKENVKEHYADVARRAEAKSASSCCPPTTISCCGPDGDENYATKIGYTLEELSEIPDAAQMASAGCGNPTALAGLKEGEVVLDLGSGGGIDVFIAAKKVGSTGKVIGVDMTQEMLDLANKNAEELGIKNVEFRKGDIEELPVESGSIDVIISNCVINLAPDKDKVFREAYRVLKPGGRIMVSDIVTEGELPESIRNDPAAWADCISGALEVNDYLNKIRTAGFENVRVVDKRGFMQIVFSAEIEAFKPF